MWVLTEKTKNVLARELVSLRQYLLSFGGDDAFACLCDQLQALVDRFRVFSGLSVA
jgi:hypothetical protein